MRASPNVVRAGVAVLVVLACALVYLGGPSRRGASTSVPPTDAGAPTRPDAASLPRIDPRPRDDARPDILLLTIDSVRADHTSAYGYDRETTPTLRALAARGTRFDRAYSTASWTSPSIASLLTGVLPSQHGVTQLHIVPDGGVETEALSAELPSLASSLHDVGYRTMGVTVTPLLDAAVGFGRGFDEYACLGFVDRETVRSSLGSRIEHLRASDTPYFLWIHIIDPRIPHTPTDPQFSTWWPATRARHPTLDFALSGIALGAILIRDQIPIPEGIEYATTAWDSEIRSADDFLEHVLVELDDGHLAVVVTSDHGEELNEHHRVGHGSTLFEEVVHVPLVIALPDQEASVATPLVSLIDVLPTLLELADAPIPEGIAGRSLMPAMRSEAFPLTRDIVMETGGTTLVRGIFDGRYKYAERLMPTHIEALFDVEEDPYEEHSILAAHPEIADPLRARLHATLDAAAARRPEAVTVELPITALPRHQLQTLGYAN